MILFEKERKAYLEKPFIDYECDPLQWWSGYKYEFPIIATYIGKEVLVCLWNQRSI